MKNKVECVLLIDDDVVTNFYNTKILRKHEKFNEIIAVTGGVDALKYLEEVSKGHLVKPNFIFLDINMPGMNGWEFVLEYNKLDKNLTKDIKLVMLTTSNNPDDFERSKRLDAVNDFINKPLSINLLSSLLKNHYTLMTD